MNRREFNPKIWHSFVPPKTERFHRRQRNASWKQRRRTWDEWGISSTAQRKSRYWLADQDSQWPFYWDTRFIFCSHFFSVTRTFFDNFKCMEIESVKDGWSFRFGTWKKRTAKISCFGWAFDESTLRRGHLLYLWITFQPRQLRIKTIVVSNPCLFTLRM